MLFYCYLIITAVVAFVLLAELFREKNWRQQIAITIILLPLVLRLLQIK